MAHIFKDGDILRASELNDMQKNVSDGEQILQNLYSELERINESINKVGTQIKDANVRVIDTTKVDIMSINLNDFKPGDIIFLTGTIPGLG